MIENGADESEFTQLSGNDEKIVEMALSKERVIWRIEERFEEEFALELSPRIRQLGGYRKRQ